MADRGRIDWRAGAESVAAAIARTRLHPEVLAWAEAAPAREPWIVGFSGGADSLAVLLLLWAHWPDKRRKLLAAHFNHRLRGSASSQDERFCRRVCESLGCRFVSAKWEQRPENVSEAAARAARQEFFEQVRGRTRARSVWLGHHLDDVAETLLMRIARGSGSGGLAAPRPVHVHRNGAVHLRPLLNLEKQEIVSVLKAARLSWREDATNVAGDYFRNRVRHSVLPAWRAAAVDRNALTGARITRERLAEEDAALDAWLEAVQPLTKAGDLNLRRLAGKPRALARRALHAWLHHHGCGNGLSRQAFETLLDQIVRQRQTRQSLDATHLAVIGPRTARVVSVPAKVSI